MGARLVVLACVVAASRATAASADPLSADDLARKNEGGYVTGLPLAAYSTDIGFGYGARAYYYQDGDRSDPRFTTTPYLYRVFLQAFVSTGGVQFHWLDLDVPKIANSEYRIRSQLIYQRNTAQNYFGLGDRSLQPLAFPGSPKTYSNFTDYNNDQQKIVGGHSYSRFDQYDLLRPIWIASIERLFAGDRVRALGGFGLSYADIHDYTGTSVDAIDPTGRDTTAPEAPTRLSLDCAAPATIVGCGGGRDNFLRFGLSYDTRDYEPDPNTGVFVDAALDLGTVLLASQYDYARFLVSARGYWSPFPEDLVFAARATFEAQSSGTPFFSMDTFPFTEDPRAGLGGHRTLRGYRQDRFVGPVMTLLNGEVRWTWGHTTIAGQKFGFFVVPFVDLGRPYDHVSELTYKDWRPSYGGAFRISWNLATIITIDYGVSPEDSGLYVNFNHIF
jgi:hypothetical protein|nr:DUF5982 domain-containing protein [Kofleriaceae bacterium]